MYEGRILILSNSEGSEIIEEFKFLIKSVKVIFYIIFTLKFPLNSRLDQEGATHTSFNCQ